MSPVRASRIVRPQLERLEDRTVPTLLAGTDKVNLAPITAGEAQQVLTASATSRDGRSVVVWIRHNTGASWDVYAQMYKADRAKLGSEIRVTASSLAEYDPSVGMDDKGNWVVAWTRFLTSGDKNVEAVRYSATGVRQGTIFRVAATAAVENGPSVASAANGAFVIGYMRKLGANVDVIANTYAANGVGLRVISVAATKSSEYYPSVARSADGRFVVAYQIGGDIRLKRFTASGDVLGKEFIVAAGANSQTLPSAAMDDRGNAVVAWQELLPGDSRRGLSSAWGVRARTVSSAGALGRVVAIQSGFQIDGEGEHAYTYYTNTAVAMDRSDGDFVVSFNKQYYSNTNGGENGDSQDVNVAEVSFSGAVRRRLTALKVDPDPNFSHGTIPAVPSALSITGADQYFVAGVTLGDPSSEPATGPAVLRATGVL
jgi:hypothetical protein